MSASENEEQNGFDKGVLFDLLMSHDSTAPEKN